MNFSLSDEQTLLRDAAQCAVPAKHVRPRPSGAGEPAGTV